MSRYQPDFILLGADNFDVFNGLCHNFSESYWSFQSKCPTEMLKNGPPYGILPKDQHWRNKEEGQMVGLNPPSTTRSDHLPNEFDGYSQDGFESTVVGGRGGGASEHEKAVILSNRPSFTLEDETEGLLYDEEFELASQEKERSGGGGGGRMGPKTQPIIDDPIQVFASTAQSQYAGGPMAMSLLPGANQPQHFHVMNDFELDSFIVEDNEEGENSLHASPHMLRQLHGQSGSIATASIVTASNHRMVGSGSHMNGGDQQYQKQQEQIRELVNHLQLYLQYAKYPANFSDFMIHDAMNNVLVDEAKPMETSTLSYSFILANIPITNQMNENKTRI